MHSLKIKKKDNDRGPQVLQRGLPSLDGNPERSVPKKKEKKAVAKLESDRL